MIVHSNQLTIHTYIRGACFSVYANTKSSRFPGVASKANGTKIIPLGNPLGSRLLVPLVSKVFKALGNSLPRFLLDELYDSRDYARFFLLPIYRGFLVPSFSRN